MRPGRQTGSAFAYFRTFLPACQKARRRPPDDILGPVAEKLSRPVGPRQDRTVAVDHRYRRSRQIADAVRGGIPLLLGTGCDVGWARHGP
ncbi:hypothetical protein OG930_36800 [Streptomyces sp. NBC_01799]|uniref:hypothetical protein n=1 Tax=Streptomyces sp. NBC_01800 TaxID=2975945 RepID=UPI002DD8EF25|nr:hypothetical protein [Streptomyces sp. NBC_01800]WSA72175.1 hypothetical protein OIE65_37435 [Streptomyces sp. NBC_01800]WSA80694.1 hypothetical protein OG930_36800 [Streptomyces sp. NBC_01799]